MTIHNYIITSAALIGALTTLLGALFAVYRWFIRQSKQDKDIKDIKGENTMIVYALFACLDGLQQLGANHAVTDAKSKLYEYINKQSHQ